MKEFIKFAKMSGAGNDFIIIDSYKNKAKIKNSEINLICRNKFSVGADGLMIIEKSNDKRYAFSMRYFNSDGNEAEMCGNGGRCIAKFAFLKGYAGKQMKFLAKDGEHTAEIIDKINVKLGMIEPFDIKKNIEIKINGKIIKGHFANTGVPHFVVPVNDMNKVDVVNLGRTLRFHKFFGKSGTNVNFVYKENENHFSIRTYERGVENETFACGTGAVATAILMGQNSPVKIKVIGGNLKVYFDKQENEFKNVFLEGPATYIMEGTIFDEALL